MREIQPNKLRFLTTRIPTILPTIIVAICLLATPVLQAVTLYDLANTAESKSCCCCPSENDTDSCPVKEIMQKDSCPCKVEQSQPQVPAPFRADIQNKFELNQNSNICNFSIASELSDKPTFLISDDLIKTVNSPPLYISNSAFLI